MIKFNKPDVLNGTQLVEELKEGGININADKSPRIDGNGDFWLDIAEADKAKAEPIVAAHIGIDQSEAKATAKAALLTQLGITAEQAKLLLS